MIQPMLASLADAPLDDPALVYEPKYDGIRAIAEIAWKPARGPRHGQPSVRLWSRNGNDKTSQYPDVARALESWAAPLARSLVLDGEIVALDEDGRPAGFQRLQGTTERTAFIAFDVLGDGAHDLRTRPLIARREALEHLFTGRDTALVRISEMARGDGRALFRRALDEGWEGLIAKRAQSIYRSGKRSPDWRKIKIVHEQEFVIGGWTEPRHSRSHLGALLLGVHAPTGDGDDGGNRRRGAGRGVRGTDGAARPNAPLVYVGHVGTGFDERELARLIARLTPLGVKKSPFVATPKANEAPHWVRPVLVAQVKFTEWTDEGRLRHPVYLGLRDDKKAAEVVEEPHTRAHGARRLARPAGERMPRPPAAPSVSRDQTPSGASSSSARSRPASPTHTLATLQSTRSRGTAGTSRSPAPDAVINQIDALEQARRDGVLLLPNGDRLKVTNLHKVFWPAQTITKGDLLRYYARVAPYILPVVADRPLVMKRFPNGIDGEPFYQHRAEDAPPGVRVETVTHGSDRRPQLIGGNLTTLLYMAQLAAISQDPWSSRVSSPEDADYTVIDLDPGEGVGFDRVLDVARWVRDELDTLGIKGFPKTSGADGLHIYIPLPPGTPYEAGMLFCQILATIVSQKHPRVATVERSVAARGPRVYVDYLQNILGKTLATAYSARASAYAGVSCPLSWKEVDQGVRREDFTIRTMPERIARVGDLWAAMRKAKGADLSRVSRYAQPPRTGRATQRQKKR